jgi:hypothetical protein
MKKPCGIEPQGFLLNKLSISGSTTQKSLAGKSKAEAKVIKGRNERTTVHHGSLPPYLLR